MIKDIRLHNFGNFKLDGGTMFGPVPKAVWGKLVSNDQNNLITMASNTLVIELDTKIHNRKIVIDHGMSNHYPDKIIKRFRIEPVQEIELPEDVTDWILTHLHFDHIGDLHQHQLRTPYPQAKIHLQEKHLATAKDPSLKELNGFSDLDTNYLASLDLNLLSGETELFPGITLKISNGHTTALQYLEIESAGGLIIFPSDLIPTIHHVNFFYHMGYDINPNILLQEKLEVLNLAANRNATIVFQHEADTPLAKIEKIDQFKFKANPIDTL